MKMKIAALLFASCGILTVVPPSCHSTPPNTPDASDGGTAGILDAATGVVDNACYLIEGVDTSGISRTVCAIVSEIISAIGFIETLRTYSDAGKASESCQYLPQTTYCATSAERAKAILYIINTRAARRTIDGGR